MLREGREDTRDSLLQPVRQRVPLPLVRPSLDFGVAVAKREEPACDEDGFATKTGPALAAHVRAASPDCVERLFGDAPESVRVAAFARANMIEIAKATAEAAVAYDGTNSTRVLQLVLFLRAGYYENWYNPDPDAFDWTFETAEIADAAVSALDAFIANDRFYDDSPEEHGWILLEFLILIDSAEQQARYLPVLKEWLRRWNPDLAQSWEFRNAVNSVFITLYRGHQRPEFADAVGTDAELVELLRDFALADWMVGGEAELLAANAARELARLLQYAEAPVRPSVQEGVAAVLGHYDYEFGASIWIAAALVATYYDDCAHYDICGFEQELEARVLASSYACGNLFIRWQSLTTSQVEGACASLAAQETRLHTLLETNEKPVADDHNDQFELVVFASGEDYRKYSNLFFGNDVDNGSIYLEGDPSDPDNTARTIVYVATWLPERPIWNLEHEHVHYLDGRYNLHGDFYDYRVDSQKTVWWLEGLAEFVSMEASNEAAEELAGGARPLLLDEVFSTTYNDGVDQVYLWSYLTVRFMFERHRAQVDSLLAFTRRGDYDRYLLHLDGLAQPLEKEWREWLACVAAADACADLVQGRWMRGWRLALLARE